MCVFFVLFLCKNYSIKDIFDDLIIFCFWIEINFLFIVGFYLLLLLITAWEIVREMLEEMYCTENGCYQWESSQIGGRLLVAYVCIIFYLKNNDSKRTDTRIHSIEL